MSIMKEYLDYLRKKYETVDFIKDDPVQFLHSFKNDAKNLEIWGFIVSLFAFGKREAFIQKLNVLFEIMNHNPYEFILNFEKNESKLNGFIYRFYKDSDIKALFFLLSEKLKKGMTLGDIFYEKRNNSTLKLLQGVYSEFEKSKYFTNSGGFSFMLSNPNKKGANKRLNMFLRWMARKGPVDLDLWHFIEPKNLIIPLDIHVGNISRKLNLLKRKQNDIKAALELTEKLKEFDPNDPVSYDFALFGAGVNGFDVIKNENLGILDKI